VSKVNSPRIFSGPTVVNTKRTKLPGSSGGFSTFSNLASLPFSRIISGKPRSRRFLPALVRDFGERPAIAIERRLLPAQLLPALNNNIGVHRMKLDPVANALGKLSGRKRGAA
jgi:hypothetical protein